MKIKSTNYITNVLKLLILFIFLITVNNYSDTINGDLKVTSYIKTKFIPVQSYSEDCFLGQQDNFLAFADRRFTVTQQGPAPNSGYLKYAFDATHNNVRWNSNDSIIIGIDFNQDISYWRAFGVNFTYNRIARSVKIEGYSTDSNTWITIYQNSSNNGNVIHSTGSYSHIRKLRFTFSGIVANGEIAIEEIWAYSAHTFFNAGGAFLRKDGGSIYGKVSIGSTNSPANLTVTGSIICPNDTSSITASAFKVGDWVIKEKNVPDYVFKDDYKLKSLQEVEKFTRENNHLPDVPSASQMKKDGVDLVEMNMALLKKVEELMLYTIQQQKEIDQLKLEIKEIEERK